jgi:hypothetical protein
MSQVTEHIGLDVRRGERKLQKVMRLPDGRALTWQKPFEADGAVGGVWTTKNGLIVIGSSDPTPFGRLQHLSVSYRSRYPSWQEMTWLRDLFMDPDRDAMMVMPVAEDYVNIHEFCLQVWETPTAWAMR